MEQRMTRVVHYMKVTGLVGSGLVLGVGGGCLPQNFWSDTLAGIVGGLVVSILNLGLTPIGLSV